MLLLVGDQGHTSFLRWLDSDRLIVGEGLSVAPSVMRDYGNVMSIPALLTLVLTNPAY